MRVLVVSDSHGHPRLSELISIATICDLVIHLGDGFDDAQKLMTVCPVPVVQVTGNHDYPLVMIPEKMIALDRLETLLTHGHVYRAKRGIDLLAGRAQALGANLVLYGHLHRKRYDLLDGIHLFCPGSCAYNYDGTPPSVGVLTIADRAVTPSWVELPPLGA